MPRKKLPETDDERLKILRCAIDQEELCTINDMAIPLSTLHEAKAFLLVFEGAGFSHKHAMEDQEKAEKSYNELFELSRLYISHFIQVLGLAVIRNEVKRENLLLYGLNPENPEQLPDLLTEEAILNWGESLIQGESERTGKGGTPIYNPAIAKVRVHYDMLKEACQRLRICTQNTLRTQEALTDLRNKADEIIWDVWCNVEEKYKMFPPDEQMDKYNKYGILFHYQKGEQLNVFS